MKGNRHPERALEQLRRIQRHSVTVNHAAPISGISTIYAEQAAVLTARNIKKLSQNAQMSLLKWQI